MTDTTQAAGLTDEQIDAFIPPSPVAPKGYWLNRERAAIREAIRAALAAQAVPAANQRHLPLAVQSMGEWKTVRYPASPAPAEAKEFTAPTIWKDAFTSEAAKFQAETLRASKLHAMLARWINRHQDEHPSGPGTRGCHVCELVAESRALLAASPTPAEAKEEPDYAAIELEHFGDPIKKTGVYATPQPQAAQPVAYIEHSIDTESGREETDLVWGKDDDLEGGLYEYTPLYTAAPALTEEQEREAFEEWAKTFRDLECDKGLVNLRYLGLHKTYVDYDVHRAWVVWQARAALRSTQGGE